MITPECKHRGKTVNETHIECFSDHFVGPDFAIRPLSLCNKPCPFADKPQLKETNPELFQLIPLPGSELLRLLSFFKLICNLYDCDCYKHAREMNENGPDWCEKNIKIIVGWLRDNSEKCGFPFSKLIAKKLIRISIKRSRKNENQTNKT